MSSHFEKKEEYLIIEVSKFYKIDKNVIIVRTHTHTMCTYNGIFIL